MQNAIRSKSRSRLALVAAFVCLLLTSLACDLSTLNPIGSGNQPEPEKRTLFQGIKYERIVRQDPRPLVIHVITIDLKTAGLKTLVTPCDPDQSLPCQAKTTSQFLESAGLQLAVNGDPFTPWRDLGPLGYSPHTGDRVAPLGFDASRGTVYHQDQYSHPTLYLYQNNKASMNALVGKVYNAVSGFKLLVWNGSIVDDLDFSALDPRTAAGLNRSGNQLVLIVVDGRQPGYSEGVTEVELAQLMLDEHIYSAMNMDGGGSSTLVMEGEDGQPEILNSPIHQHIPGNERPVANHLGFFAK